MLNERITALVFLTALFAGNGFAQTAKCPTVLLKGQKEAKITELPRLTVSVKGGDRRVTPTYKWSLSGGSIASGQGTSGVVVTTEGLADGSFLTVSVEVGGYDRSCASVASLPVPVKKKKIATRLYQEMYTTDPLFEEFLLRLFNERAPVMGKGYVLIFPGETAPAGEFKRLEKLAKAFIKSHKKERASDYVIKKGPSGANTSFEMWLVPPGAPQPSQL